MATGKVKFFNAAKGFGFITPDVGSPEVYAPATAINIDGVKTLVENQRVQYEVIRGPKGLTAQNIRLA